MSVCTGSWIYGRMGLLDGKAATNRKEPDRLEASNMGKVPIDRLAEIAPKCRISRARVVDAGRIISGGGIASGMEVGFHLLRRAGYDENFISDVARVMEYKAAYELYRDVIVLILSAVIPGRARRGEPIHCRGGSGQPTSRRKTRVNALPERSGSGRRHTCAITLRSMSRTFFTPQSAMVTSSSLPRYSIALATPASPPAPRP